MKDHSNKPWTITPISMQRRWEKPSRIKSWIVAHAHKPSTWNSLLIFVTSILASLGTGWAIGSSFKFMSATVFFLLGLPSFFTLPFLVGLFGLVYIEFKDDFDQYAGVFTGMVTLHGASYLVSNASLKRLSSIIGVSEDTLSQWPHWHDTTIDGMTFYALSSEAKKPDDGHAIVKDCARIMLDPSDHRGDDLLPVSKLPIGHFRVDSWSDKIVSTNQVLDDTDNMMQDIGLTDHNDLIKLRSTLHSLQQDVILYQQDQVALQLILQRIDDVHTSAMAIHETIAHLHHDITVARTSSQAIDRFQQRIETLDQGVSEVVG